MKADNRHYQTESIRIYPRTLKGLLPWNRFLSLSWATSLGVSTLRCPDDGSKLLVEFVRSSLVFGFHTWSFGWVFDRKHHYYALMKNDAPSSSGKTADSESVNAGSIPAGATND